ncbi:MAG TPA: efflux RND transporter periplasmic adaptor subunit [Hyphomicrobiaceae bacterium]|nr:efflux RND transporter periplasmic adaptor subunit [Hyphomicrobiaceae bacterium]
MQQDARGDTSARPATTTPQSPKARETRGVAKLARGLGLVALVIAALAAAFVMMRGTVVKTQVAKRGSIAEVVYATGTVEPVHWAKVASLQRKRIVWICSDCEGRQVKQGEVLARLDDVEEKALLAELEARLKRVQEDAARIETLVQRNVTARTTYDEKLTQVREFEARVAAQRDRIKDLELKAPMDGYVLRRDGEIGEIAGTATNDVIFWIGEKSPLRIVSDVNEEDILRVSEGQDVLLRHDGQANRALTAKVQSITPKGDPQSKTFRVFLALPSDTPLKIGMSVEANIIARRIADALILPAEAVSSDGNVQVVENGRVRWVKVETGVRGTTGLEIRGGLADGARVVVPFTPSLKDGARVRPETVAGSGKTS